MVAEMDALVAFRDAAPLAASGVQARDRLLGAADFSLSENSAALVERALPLLAASGDRLFQGSFAGIVVVEIQGLASGFALLDVFFGALSELLPFTAAATRPLLFVHDLFRGAGSAHHRIGRLAEFGRAHPDVHGGRWAWRQLDCAAGSGAGAGARSGAGSGIIAGRIAPRARWGGEMEMKHCRVRHRLVED